ncbi:helix-turn-helix domain-containing protein [Clostridium sp. JNZ J1-5]
MDYISVKQAAEKWGISERRVQVLCGKGRVKGVFKLGNSWAIPKDAEKPFDARKKDNT